MKKRVLFISLFTVIFSLFVAQSLAFDLTEMGLKQAGSYDLGGNTVTIISWTGTRMENYFNEDPVVVGRLLEAEELFNCNIEFLQTADIPETNIARMMAGDSKYDLWYTQSRIGYYELVSQGAAYPVEDSLPEEYYQSLTNYERESINILKYKGKRYGIGETHYGGGIWNLGVLVMFYNKDMIEEAGFTDPYELYENDKWDWDAMTEIMVGVTEDQNGDGFYDQWGTSFIREIVPAVANGVSVTKVNREGKRVFSFDELAAIETMEQLVEWDELGVTGGGFHDGFPNGTTAFYMHFLSISEEFDEVDFNWGIVPIPKGPSAERYYYPHWSPSTVIIPANAEDPEALIALRAFLFREDDVSLDLVMSRYIKDRNSAKVFMEIQENWRGEARYLMENFGGEDLYSAIDQIKAREKTPKAAMDEVAPVIQAKINDLYDQE